MLWNVKKYLCADSTMQKGDFCTPTYFVGDTTSKQNLRSMSSQGLTEQSLKSSTTTVRASYNKKKDLKKIFFYITYIIQEAIETKYCNFQYY